MALSTNFTQRVPETTKFSKITQNKGEDGAVLKIEKSPYLGRSSSDFDEIWHADALRPS